MHTPPLPLLPQLTALAAALAPVLALAQKTEPPAGTTALPTVVVSATRHALPLAEAPAAMTVVTAEQMAERATDNLLQALRAEPGVSAFGRPIGGRKALALRGMDPRHTLILVDGQRIAASDGLVGASDFQLDWAGAVDIERIEVVRGPMSVLYGAEALGGVIQVITKPLPDRLEARGLVEGREGHGGGSGHRAAAALRLPLGEKLRAGFSFSDARREATPSQGDPRLTAVEGRHPREAALRLEAMPAPEHRLRLDARLGDEDRWLDARERSGARRYHQSLHSLERRLLSLGWEGQWAQGWESQLRAYGSELAVRNVKTNGVASLRPNTVNERVLEGQIGGELGERGELGGKALRLTTGFELRREALDNSGLPGGHAQAEQQSLYAQLEAPLRGALAGLALTAGLRADHHERYGTEWSPRAYAVWRLQPDWVLKGGWGHGFKAPNLKQIDPNYREDEGPHTYLGRADLRPETNDNWELGLSWEHAQWGASLMGFHNRVRDLINPRLVGGTPARGIYQFENLDRARLQGVETALAWRAGAVHLQAHHSWLSARDGAGLPLDKRARRTAGLRADWRTANWSAGLAWEQQAGLHLASATAGQPPQRVPTLNLLNLHASWALSPQWRLRAGVDNATHVRLAAKSPLFSYEELPRTARLSLEGRW
ncbi:outer membrane receptor for ferrienterochelin and colicins [Inhella inkyongensis]|uniref:Outer membrane receptor for ferrienterochelin and colicins n=1 Tax=Inhella inkyongensis TaxID=392593 RepID=A0A840RY18_9BURK|nr:TonB-dependent receptor [Inhella inkyongensis]MBB5203597.1 outer membrane receptor for ferrienterochelin and colicins [Inhella inkyongensis]